MQSVRLTASANGVAKYPGELYTVVCEGGSTPGTVTVYDSLTQSGTIITSPPVPAGTTVPISFFRQPFRNGLSVTITGGVQAVTLEWW